MVWIFYHTFKVFSWLSLEFTSSKNKIKPCSAWIYFVCKGAQILCAVCVIFREHAKDQGCLLMKKWVSVILPMSYSMMNWLVFTFIRVSYCMKHTNSNITAAVHQTDSANRLSNDINLKTTSFFFVNRARSKHHRCTTALRLIVLPYPPPSC